MRAWTVAIVCLLVQPPCASADVASVTITSRSVVADGHATSYTHGVTAPIRLFTA